MEMTLYILSFCLLYFCLSVSCLLDPGDFLALQTIRKSLDDMSGSSFFTSWDFTSDPCNFAGVFCDGDRVVTLNLGDPRAGAPGLTGRIDPAIAHLSSLVELTIVPGRVMGHLPESISQLTKLRFLALNGNFISGKLPESLGSLRNLQTLDLGYNQIIGSIPGSVGSLPHLTNLILHHNKISGPIPRFVSPVLSRIDVSHNTLSGTIEPDFLPPSLQYLSLSWNQITGPVDRLLNRMKRLRYLDLSMNQFTGLIPAQLFSFPITTLQLQRNGFFGPVQPSFPVSIQTVDISFNQLSGSVSSTFSTVKNLYLNNNRFTGRVPKAIVDGLLGSHIHILYLQHNYLTGMEMNPTVDIPLSNSICLHYNCMVPPVESSCPLRAGKQKSRPSVQCNEWKG